jgi:HlyD family secretion protein
MIRDTSGQDTVLKPTRRLDKRLVIGAAAGVALVALSTWLFAGWRSSSHVANAERLRIAAVTQGTLLRDASVNGRVVAAVSPTLFAPASGTVTLKVQAGATVHKGDVLAVIASPDLDGAAKREESLYTEMQADIARQEILAQKQKLTAVRDADQAEIDRAAAQRVRLDHVGAVDLREVLHVQHGLAFRRRHWLTFTRSAFSKSSEPATTTRSPTLSPLVTSTAERLVAPSPIGRRTAKPSSIT